MPFVGQPYHKNNSSSSSSSSSLKRSSTCVFTNSTGAGIFAITDTKLYVPIVTLLTEDSAKL